MSLLDVCLDAAKTCSTLLSATVLFHYIKSIKSIQEKKGKKNKKYGVSCIYTLFVFEKFFA